MFAVAPDLFYLRLASIKTAINDSTRHVRHGHDDNDLHGGVPLLRDNHGVHLHGGDRRWHLLNT